MKASEEFKKVILHLSLVHVADLSDPGHPGQYDRKSRQWRWRNMAFIGIGSFLLSFVWRRLLSRKEKGRQPAETGNVETLPLGRRLLAEPGSTGRL